MPNRSGQKGITCIRPTAPAEETAQRLKSLSTSMTAITSPGGSLDSPVRCVSQYTCRRIFSRSAGSCTNRSRRGSIMVYQTAASKRSAKHCACPMARWTTGPSAGSRCWSARAAGDASRLAAMSAASAISHPLAPQACLDECHGFVGRELRALGIAAIAVLQAAGLQAPIADHQPMRDAEQLRVGELDAGAGIAVVIEHLDAAGGELVVEAVVNFAYPGGFLQVERHEHHLEGSQRLRPDDPPLIVILLDGRGDDARHPDAIAAHEEGHFLAALIEYARLERLAVLAAELEDVADLDAPGDLQASPAGRARISLAHVA